MSRNTVFISDSESIFLHLFLWGSAEIFDPESSQKITIILPEGYSVEREVQPNFSFIKLFDEEHILITRLGSKNFATALQRLFKYLEDEFGASTLKRKEVAAV